MKIKYLFIIQIILVLFLYGCKSLKPVADPSLPSIPEHFNNAKDTTNSALLSHRLLFKDTFLIKLIDSAVARNYDLQMAMQRIKMAEADLMVTKGALRPRVDGSVVSALRRFGLYTMDGAGNSSTFMLPGLIVPTDLPDYFIGFQHQ